MFKPDLIIFDCDGVLVDSEVLSCRCLSAVLAGYGIDLGVEQALELFLGRSTAAVMMHYRGLGRPIPERFSAELGAGVRAAFGAELRPIEGVASVLAALRTPFCVASSSDLDRVSFSLSVTGSQRLSARGSIPRKWWRRASPLRISSCTRLTRCARTRAAPW